MGETLLRKWLNLPSGPWPPDYFTLLELSHDETSPEEIEERVFVRMERLRKYQITHPEVVSEGMNLLAKAMDTLTDPANRQSYLLTLGIKSPSPHRPDEPTPNLLPLDEPVSPEKRGDFNENSIPSALPSDTDDPEALLLEPIYLEEIEEEIEAEEEEISQAIILPEWEPLVISPPPYQNAFHHSVQQKLAPPLYPNDPHRSVPMNIAPPPMGILPETQKKLGGTCIGIGHDYDGVWKHGSQPIPFWQSRPVLFKGPPSKFDNIKL